MNFKEIIEALKKSEITVSDFAHEEICVPDDFVLPEPLNSQRSVFISYWNQSYHYRQEHPKPEYDNVAALKEYLSAVGIPEWKEVAQHGGEGQGDEWWSVKYFPDHDVYVKVEGWYQSYNGTEFEGWEDAVYEVRPQEKTITVYE